jgi:hypothetical protein
MCMSAVAASLSGYGKAETSVPDPEQLDIKNLNEQEINDFLDTENAKRFLEKYRNSQNLNLVFLAAKNGQFKLLRKMKEKKIDIASMLRASNIEDIVKEKSVDEFLEIAPELINEEYVRNIFMRVDLKNLKDFPLDIELWDRIEKSKYLTLLSKNEILKTQLPEEFIFVGLSTILDHDPSLIRTGFLQKDFSKREYTNLLWYTFIKRYDELRLLSATKLPYAIHILQVTQLFKKQNEDNSNSKSLEEIISLQSNVLATGGSFGVNFERTATSEEAKVMIETLESIGSELRNVQRILNAFFVDYFQDLNPAQKSQLKDHQINCAVIALHSALFESLGENVFETIDLALRKRLSRSFANSNDRHGKLMELAGRSSVRNEEQDPDYEVFYSSNPEGDKLNPMLRKQSNPQEKQDEYK